MDAFSGFLYFLSEPGVSLAKAEIYTITRHILLRKQSLKVKVQCDCGLPIEAFFTPFITTQTPSLKRISNDSQKRHAMPLVPTKSKFRG
jgi:hypothetical protein